MIGVIDYGVGNVTAFLNVYSRLGISAIRASKQDDVAACSHLILPGVGAFDHTMSAFEQSGLRRPIEERVFSESIPILGVCVGMQMLSKGSDEGELSGLGWLDAEVRSLEQLTRRALPHMGWNQLVTSKESPLFLDLEAKPYFYFLHSYYFQASTPDLVLAHADYEGLFECVVQSANIYGIQCHPEKSHLNGELFLRNFARL